MVHTRKKNNKKRLTEKKINEKNIPTKYFIHKQSSYGVGTFATADIPVDTIVLKETPYTLSDDGDYYIFKLIKKFLSDKENLPHFLSLVPTKINCKNKNSYCIPYKDIEYGHKEFLPQLSRSEMVLYYMKLKRNMFRFYNNPGICFIATRMNHSCNPNITYSVKGKGLVFKTLKPILKNEELFDSYIDYNLPKKERQDLLLKRYGFHCKCTKCMNEN